MYSYNISTYGSMLIFMVDISLSLCLLSAAFTVRRKTEKNVYIHIYGITHNNNKVSNKQ